MATVNFARREILCKVVYYGPGLCGKTTNLQSVHAKVPENVRGNLTSVATKQDRTLFFDLLPIDIGKIKDFAVRLQLYTVPGQVYYNASRKIVLKGVDGVVFVADSQMGKMDENIESLKNLRDNLIDNGTDLTTISMILQYNKRDLSPIYEIEELNAKLNPNNLSYFESVATTGQGVFHTLKGITRLVVEDVRVRLDAAEKQPKPAPPVAPPVAAQPSSTPTKPEPPAQDAPEEKKTVEPEHVEEEKIPKNITVYGTQKGLWGKVSGLFKRTED